MLTVAMMYWGSWGGNRKLAGAYVRNLTRMVRENLSVQFKVVCFVDSVDDLERVERVEYRLIPQSVLKWRLNLPKLYLHHPDNGMVGTVLAFDLDTVVVGALLDFAKCGVDGCVCGIRPFNPKNQNKGWLPGGVLKFEAGKWVDLFNEVASKPVKWANRTQGKERFIYSRLLDDQQKMYWQDVLPGQLISYKRHCKKRGGFDGSGRFKPNIPQGARIIAFHGTPQPHMLKEIDPVMYNIWEGGGES